MSHERRQPDPLDLAANEIHLWFADCGRFEDEKLAGRYRALLDPSERAQGERFRFQKDRRRHLVTRALARTTLARYLDVRPEDLVFTANRFGKPDVQAEARPARSGLSYNISHTNELVVLAVACRREIGVDIESSTRGDSSLAIADRFFSPAESSALRQMPPELRRKSFFQLWTLKESYIKARGMGLSLPLDRFAFELKGEHRLGFSNAEARDDPTRWHFWQFEARADHIGALCAERIGHGPPRLVTREVLPLVGETIVPLRVVRESDDILPTPDR